MDERRFLALEEEFYRMTGDMVATGGNLPPLETDDEWSQILRVEEERFCRQVSDGRFPPAADNEEDPIVTNRTPHTTMDPPHTELSSDFEEPEGMMIDTQEDELDTEEGQPRDFEEHDEVITATDGDEVDDEGELPRDFGESEELTLEEQEEQRVIFRYYEARETYRGEFEISDPLEGRGIRWPPRQIKDFLLARMETGTLGPDDLKCAICQSEFGKERGEVEKSSSSQGLPGEESAEYPVKLPCGHVFGHWCIEKWLLIAQPASCPICRHQFQPV